MHDKVETLGRVAGFVIIPRHQLDKVVGESDTSLGIEYRCAWIANEVT